MKTCLNKSRTARIVALTGLLLLSGGGFPSHAQQAPIELIQRIDRTAVGQFERAWTLAHGGTVDMELVVLVIRAANGTYTARVQPLSNHHKRGSFRFHSGVAAVFHTHPNSCHAQPSRFDRKLADRIRVPIATMTRRGLFVYDPVTRKTAKLMPRLEWLDAANWGVGGELANTAGAGIAD